jgi:GNAT superfamily N-acetyltransferase
MKIDLRQAKEADEDAVFRLAAALAASFTVEEKMFRASFAALQESPDAYLAIAEVDGEVVGYVLGFRHLAFFANGHVAWIEELMVEESRRRLGVGRLLMESAEAWASAGGCKLVALATRRAADFYQSLGYKESATYFRKRL